MLPAVVYMFCACRRGTEISSRSIALTCNASRADVTIRALQTAIPLPLLQLKSAAVTRHCQAQHETKARAKHAHITLARVAFCNRIVPVPSARTILAQPRQVALVLRQLLLLLPGIHQMFRRAAAISYIHC